MAYLCAPFSPTLKIANNNRPPTACPTTVKSNAFCNSLVPIIMKLRAEKLLIMAEKVRIMKLIGPEKSGGAATNFVRIQDESTPKPTMEYIVSAVGFHDAKSFQKRAAMSIYCSMTFILTTPYCTQTLIKMVIVRADLRHFQCLS